jgi:cold shock CspA family protein
MVKTFDRDRGTGLLESEPARALYGNDVVFLVGALPQGRESPNIGEEFEFGVVVGQNGPQACNITATVPSAPVAPADPALGRFLGVIRAFDMNKGWGHIECREARAIFGKDIFLLRSALRGAEVAAGNQLEFAVNVGPKGPIARDVCLVDYGPSLADAAQYRSMPY